MPEDEGSDKRKSHRARQSGVKAEKKKNKNIRKDAPKDRNNLSARQRNPKAFAINSAQRAERNFRRNEDLTAKKQHIPVVDQTTEVQPPVVVAVVGPPKVGKTTLIRNLIKSFTRTNVSDIRGPITIVSSKKRRITLLECNNDINSMIDVAKCADLVLLLCDASYGFEMEIFEFLNICQVHGLPKILGVLTHLDMIKNPKQLRKRKKELKHRFWTEVYDGAKLFYLSGLLHGEYLRNEVKNLGRFISVMKYRPLQWRGAHSYLLVDRVEDITNTDMIRRNPKCDRDVVLYGYVRGVPLKQEHMVHIAGLGDVRIEELSAIRDPCPLPGTEKKRSLLEKERLLYAPMSGVGGIVYDKDAVYIELQGSHSHKKEKSATAAEQEELVGKLIEKKQTIDMQIEEQEFRLFSNGEAIKSKDFKEQVDIQTNEESDEDEEGVDSGVEQNDSSDDDMENAGEFDNDGWRCEDSNDESEEIKHSDDESNMSDEEEYQNITEFNSQKETSDSDETEDSESKVIANSLQWKENLAEKARDAFLLRHSESRNLMRLVYGSFSQNEVKIDSKQRETTALDDEEELGGLFKVVAKQQTEMQRARDMRDRDENCFFESSSGVVRSWLDDKNKELIKNCFVTGKWKASDDAENLLRLDEMSDADSEIYGDFEDMETGEKHFQKTKLQTNDDEDNAQSSTVAVAGESNQKLKLTRVEEGNLNKREKLMAKKLKLKAKFDAEYDDNGGAKEDETGRIKGDHDFYEGLKAEALKQSQLNKSEFANLEADIRLQIEGFRAGLYVRLGFKNIPAEFIEHLDPSYPILVGGLNIAEENIGFVNCKVKKHRWYKKILKTGDPLIISMGWRRFQTVPVYAKVEDNFRQRYLKYTPNHVTCSMTFWGPITPQNTGFLALQSVAHDLEEMKRLGFRIAATGCVTELDKSTQIMKKLKLVGHPFKIYKKSAFVKGMFNSTLEVAKFEGAKIRTVSGIRGQIKKAHNTPEGSFRATFEDKILLSDIVFCRTWFRVDVQRFYAPITTLLLPPAEKTQWQGMKTLGQLKRERQLQNEAQLDSLYTEIKREPKSLKPLSIPKALQRALPYKNKPKFGPLDPKMTAEQERVVVIRSPHEQKVAKMLKMVETNYKEKRSRDRRDTKLRLKKFRSDKRAEEAHKLKRQKELRKKVSRTLSKMRSKEQS